jgi:hypothetical protein
LRKLEERFARELVVIGVHSGKFLAERVTRNVRQAVVQLGLDHPVVNDRLFRIWRSYAVTAWPTLTVIDPEGRIASQQAGEIPAEALAPVLHEIIAQADKRGTLNRSPIQFPVEPPPATPLLFPTKLLVDSVAERLIVSDTSHHRIIVVLTCPPAIRYGLE